MKAYFEDFYGQGRFIFEDKRYVEVNGQLVTWQGKIGKAYSIQDKSSHNGGHGIGQMHCCQLVICTDKMELIKVKSAYKVFDIEVEV